MISRTVIRPFHAVLVTASLALASPLLVVADESSLAHCSALEDAEARLACYDEIAKQPKAPPEEKSPGMKKAEEEDQDAETFTAKVTRCEETLGSKYYFYFDNGQVWKQVKADRERYKDCSFTVTVTRDFFGYKMQLEGEQRRIRISRVK